VIVNFDAGTEEPTVGLTLTGAVSGDTGVVEEINLESGTWAGGDAAGRIYLTSASGVNDSNAWGQDNEALTATTGACVANGAGWQILDGRMHPLDNLINRDGKYYCRAHYDMVYGDEGQDEAGRNFDKNEDYRNVEMN
jgi:hypothetical protein